MRVGKNKRIGKLCICAVLFAIEKMWGVKFWWEGQNTIYVEKIWGFFLWFDLILEKAYFQMGGEVCGLVGWESREIQIWVVGEWVVTSIARKSYSPQNTGRAHKNKTKSSRIIGLDQSLRSGHSICCSWRLGRPGNVWEFLEIFFN